MRQILEESERFGGMSAGHLDEIEKISVPKEYGRGETIFFEGDP